MAVEPSTTEPTRQEMAAHVHDYAKFTKLFKFGAIAVFIIAAIVVLIIGT